MGLGWGITFIRHKKGGSKDVMSEGQWLQGAAQRLRDPAGAVRPRNRVQAWGRTGAQGLGAG